MVEKYLNIKDNRIIIKEYEKSYKENVIKFLKKVAIEEFGFEEWREYFDKALFLNMDKSKEAFFIAINENEEIIGTIGISNDEISNTAKLHSFYVRKDYRKNGVGTSLYKYSLKFVEKSRYNSVILHTYNIFGEAIKFYKNNGFKVDASIKSKDGFWFIKNIGDNKKYNWNDYFANLRKKYNMRISLKKALIINLDGKGTTTNKFVSLIDKNDNGFLGMMEKTVKFFSYKYNCIAIFGTDEVSFIFETPLNLIKDLNEDLNTKSDEVISIFL